MNTIQTLIEHVEDPYQRDVAMRKAIREGLIQDEVAEGYIRDIHEKDPVTGRDLALSRGFGDLAKECAAKQAEYKSSDSSSQELRYRIETIKLALEGDAPDIARKEFEHAVNYNISDSRSSLSDLSNLVHVVENAGETFTGDEKEKVGHKVLWEVSMRAFAGARRNASVVEDTRDTPITYDYLHAYRAAIRLAKRMGKTDRVRGLWEERIGAAVEADKRTLRTPSRNNHLRTAQGDVYSDDFSQNDDEILGLIAKGRREVGYHIIRSQGSRVSDIERTMSSDRYTPEQKKRMAPIAASTIARRGIYSLDDTQTVIRIMEHAPNAKGRVLSPIYRSLEREEKFELAGEVAMALGDDTLANRNYDKAIERMTRKGFFDDAYKLCSRTGRKEDAKLYEGLAR